MVEHREFMKIGMEKCAPTGSGTQEARREVFKQLAQTWTDEKQTIKQMDAADVRRRLECP